MGMWRGGGRESKGQLTVPILTILKMVTKYLSKYLASTIFVKWTKMITCTTGAEKALSHIQKSALMKGIVALYCSTH